jgi:surfeit locus 1 family protein
MSSVLLKGRWLAGHVVVVLMVGLFIVLGFWQLSRHNDQREFNTRLEERLEQEPVDLGTLAGEPADLEYRAVRVEGSFLGALELQRRPRTLYTRLGYDAVTPFMTDYGILLVNRGFIADDDPRQPPQGEARLTGILRESQAPSRFGPRNPEDEVLTEIARIDIERLQAQFDNDLYPMYLDLTDMDPMLAEALASPPVPEPSRRTNLAYAIQWWSFAVIGVVGWPALLNRRVLR